MDLTGLEAALLSQVKIKDEYMLNAAEKEAQYLLSLNSDRLLAGFRENSGMGAKGIKRYSGWEEGLIGGHTLGHYLTACVQCYSSAHIEKQTAQRVLEVMRYMTESLKECQDVYGTGFLFGAPAPKGKAEMQFDNLEAGKGDIFTEAWVPWYTMHKIIEGFVSLAGLNYRFDEDLPDTQYISETAKDIAGKLADWVYFRTMTWNDETKKRVLNVEYGGMNDCLYDVYALTGKNEHREAAHIFDEDELFERVANAEPGDNVLDNIHANTTIPKFIGAIKRYVYTGETNYLTYGERFWEYVMTSHTYVTGDHGETEHFGKDGVLNEERTNINCETCNAYNMTKMGELLLSLTGDAAYADELENLFYNSVLPSQNPDTGMTMYFQPMGTGYFKVYSTPDTKFWCCTGSGMENFSKLGSGIYYRQRNLLAINRYIASDFEDEDTELTMDADLLTSDTVRIEFNKKFKGNIALRIPRWIDGEMSVTVDGDEYGYAVTGAKPAGSGFGPYAAENTKGYALIGGPFEKGSVIELTIPMTVKAHNHPDAESEYAFTYGPYVLAAKLGTTDMETMPQGVDVVVPSKKLVEHRFIPSGTEKIAVSEGSVSAFVSELGEHLKKRSDSAQFRLMGTNANLTFIPYFMLHNERYGIYFELSDNPSDYNRGGSTAFDVAGQNTGEPQTEAKAENAALKADTAVEPEYYYDEFSGTYKQVGGGGENSYGMPGTASSSYTAQEDDYAGDDVEYVYDEYSGTYKPVRKNNAAFEPEPLNYQELKSVREADSRQETAQPEAEQPGAEQYETLIHETEQEDAEQDESSGIQIDTACGKLYYSDARRRLLLKLNQGYSNEYATLHTTLGAGESVEIDREMCNRGDIRAAIKDECFTSHRLRFYRSIDFKAYEEYDLVIMRTDSETDGRGHQTTCAYNTVTGSFAGELCYLVDRTRDEFDNEELGSYNSKPFMPYGADPKTGYFWGIYGTGSEKSYVFELEDGNYEIKISLMAPEWCHDRPAIYLDPGKKTEKLLGENLETEADGLTYRVRAKNKKLSIGVVSDSFEVTIWKLEIRALGTVAEEGDYICLSDDEDEAYDYHNLYNNLPETNVIAVDFGGMTEDTPAPETCEAEPEITETAVTEPEITETALTEPEQATTAHEVQPRQVVTEEMTETYEAEAEQDICGYEAAAATVVEPVIRDKQDSAEPEKVSEVINLDRHAVEKLVAEKLAAEKLAAEHNVVVKKNETVSNAVKIGGVIAGTVAVIGGIISIFGRKK